MCNVDLINGFYAVTAIITDYLNIIIQRLGDMKSPHLLSYHLSNPSSRIYGYIS